jgi:hypothetical protein
VVPRHLEPARLPPLRAARSEKNRT